MITQRFFLRLAGLALAGFILVACGAAAAGGTGGDSELTAVFLVSGIYPGTSLALDLLHIGETGPATFPDDSQLLQTVTDYYQGMPYAPIYSHQAVATAGNFRLYLSPPMDFGAMTIVDLRDGSVVFAAEVIVMGYGATLHPVVSTHDWLWEPGPPAVEPAGTGLLPNPLWAEDYYGSQTDLAQAALDHLRQTDVVRAFGNCHPYQVTSFLHTPTVWILDPTVAFQVLILSGHAPPPWGPEPVDTTPVSLDRIKALFR